MLFRNNTAYHDVHHQLHGSKYNFSQPFFVTWDKILGTHMPSSLILDRKSKEESSKERNIYNSSHPSTNIYDLVLDFYACYISFYVWVAFVLEHEGMKYEGLSKRIKKRSKQFT
ncbi:hypothetical protein HPP92_015876 [Vanilla planifolia]|uniref:Fatty acid hydroxylase domain-containing protein n=1 Tax=Vanilla planifolia TaxID=51239 RepID=A0A835US61_VANPL|nr:hypothetical protein HPP92_016481 [Vanilla planifolia]KAG0471330.1 hypothetical protein HPP92_015876 [Vanilla planifolia]